MRFSRSEEQPELSYSRSSYWKYEKRKAEVLLLLSQHFSCECGSNVWQR
jgi:hypothetical protein